MDLQAKKILHINLEKQISEVKTLPDLNKFVGGVGVGLKLLETLKPYDPVAFSVGPLNGFFPFVSKTSVVLFNEGAVEDLYIGGTLSTRIRFAGIDSIVLLGKASQPTTLYIENEHVLFCPQNTQIESLGLPGKRSVLETREDNVILDGYFLPPEKFLSTKLQRKNVEGFVVTGTQIRTVPNFEKYKELYSDILARTRELNVEKGFFPSCSGCPMGCAKSKVGEIGGNVLIHSLVACHLAQDIYTNVSTTFSCLNVLGYDYTHEDLEGLPKLIKETLKTLHE
ncbi:aldehyde ferredoxin oxidoreductase N-terminal domain-containing protein [Patescibacteria group bacterium]